MRTEPDRPAQPDDTTVDASPNKSFFVSMLTRDIELQDAILDLLDNCIDGIVRSLDGAIDGDRPYAGYYAHIKVSRSRFEILDNCGGIPIEIARKKAFMMGRPPGEHDEIATVGMYGIGMKRAIFKMGTSCVVRSEHNGVGFSVSITPKWMNDPNDWKLPISPLPAGSVTEGTQIVIDRLRPDIARRFDESQDKFISEFKAYVSQHYSFILGKGFEVTVNDFPIKPETFEILSAGEEAIGGSRAALAPFVFRGKVKNVDIELWAGLWREIPDDDEMEREYETRGSRDNAGWTIVCNDRVVVYRDKTRLTGWGEAGVPNYHGQFIAITGIVIMHAENPWLLPLTTTKRGIDASSETFSIVKEYMREATRTFTSFTNRWKRSPRELDRLYRDAAPRTLSELRNIASTMSMSTVKKIPGARRFSPQLPIPEAGERDTRISFARPRAEVEETAEFLFEDPQTAPSAVGIGCFERVLAEARKSKGVSA
jgi:hypothetical protein